MTKKITPQIDQQKSGWTFKPNSGHHVQFYKSESDLIEPLSGYIRVGLANGETCVVVATEIHLKNLNNQLRKSGLDISAARKSGRYVTLDAAEILSRFMVNDLPDRNRFFTVIGGLMEKLTAKGKPVRAYGEMVALLWKDGNKDAVIQLENLWNELAGKYGFSLFCAYPQLHFIMDYEACSEIVDCHNVNLYALASGYTPAYPN